MADELAPEEGEIPINENDFGEIRLRNANLSQFNSYDHLIHHSIRQKRLSMSFISGNIIKRERFLDNTFNNFLIIGCPTENDLTKNPPEPEVLFIYPSYPLIFSPNDFETVVKFCFPNGFKPCSAQPDNGEKQQDQDHFFLSQFVFRLTEAASSKPVYGVCTHFTAAHVGKSFFYDSFSKQYPFCFCFLTTNPNFTVLFQYSVFLSRWTCMNSKFVSHQNAYDNYTVPTEDETTLLPGMVYAAGTQRMNSIRIPRPFIQELTWFYTLKSKKDGEEAFSLSPNFKLVMPRILSPNKYIQFGCLDSLFSLMSLKNILRLYSNLLLEVQTVFISEKIHQLTLATMAAVTLLYPFNFNGTIMPLLPRDPTLLQLLESPVPYITGILVDETQPFTPPEGVCVVDLDHDTIIEAESVPEVPNYSKMKQTLKSILRDHQAQIKVPQRNIKIGVLKKTVKVNEKYIEFIKTTSPFAKPRVIIDFFPQKYIFTPEVANKIMECFETSIAPTVDSLIKPCFVTETTDINHPVTVFNKELFLDSVPERARQFYSQFSTTTMFQDFCDTKTDATSQRIVYETLNSARSSRRGRSNTTKKLTPSEFTFEPSAV